MAILFLLYGIFYYLLLFWIFGSKIIQHLVLLLLDYTLHSIVFVSAHFLLNDYAIIII